MYTYSDSLHYTAETNIHIIVKQLYSSNKIKLKVENIFWKRINAVITTQNNPKYIITHIEIFKYGGKLEKITLVTRQTKGTSGECNKQGEK